MKKMIKILIKERKVKEIKQKKKAKKKIKTIQFQKKKQLNQ